VERFRGDTGAGGASDLLLLCVSWGFNLHDRWSGE
jgi:hypothetical protein